MTPALIIVGSILAILWNAWRKTRYVDLEYMGFVEVKKMQREKIGFDTRNIIAEAKDVLNHAATLMAFRIGRSEWNQAFCDKVDAAERTLEYFKVKQ